MKGIQLTIIALFLGIFGAFAQKGVQKIVISTPTIQCDMCKGKIERQVGRAYGVNSVKVDVKKKTTTVEYITERTNSENIKAEIANAGYDADDVSANPESYGKLPKCCKKPAQ